MSEPTGRLGVLCGQITEMVAIASDECLVNDSAMLDEWLEELQNAVSDGLDAASDRAFAREHLSS